jgi:hypothetical protein
MRFIWVAMTITIVLRSNQRVVLVVHVIIIAFRCLVDTTGINIEIELKSIETYHL